MENNEKMLTSAPDLPKYYWESPSRSNLNAAMVAFSLENISVKKDRDVEFTTKTGGKMVRKYVTLDNILLSVKAPLAKHGLFIEQHLAGEIVLTRLNHISGEYVMSGFLYQKMDGNSLTNTLQNAGGGLSYIKRYAISALLGIPSDEDNDGSDGSNYGGEKKSGSRPAPAPSNNPRPAPASKVELTPEQLQSQLRSAIDEISTCPDITCLKATWTKFRSWQKDPDFIYAKDERKKFLEIAAEESVTITPGNDTIKFSENA